MNICDFRYYKRRQELEAAGYSRVAAERYIEIEKELIKQRKAGQDILQEWIDEMIFEG